MCPWTRQVGTGILGGLGRHGDLRPDRGAAGELPDSGGRGRREMTSQARGAAALAKTRVRGLQPSEEPCRSWRESAASSRGRSRIRNPRQPEVETSLLSDLRTLLHFTLGGAGTCFARGRAGARQGKPSPPWTSGPTTRGEGSLNFTADPEFSLLQKAGHCAADLTLGWMTRSDLGTVSTTPE